MHVNTFTGFLILVGSLPGELSSNCALHVDLNWIWKIGTYIPVLFQLTSSYTQSPSSITHIPIVVHINKARLLYLHRMPLSISDISALSRETRAHDLDQSQAQRKPRGQLVLIDWGSSGCTHRRRACWDGVWCEVLSMLTSAISRGSLADKPGLY